MICPVFNTSHMGNHQRIRLQGPMLGYPRSRAGYRRAGDHPEARSACGGAVPASRTHAEYPQLELKGTVIVTGDIVEPAVPEEHWESLGP